MRNDQVSGNFGGSPPKVSAPLLLTNDGIIGRRRFIIPLTPGANSDLVPVEVCISVDFSNSVFFFLLGFSLNKRVRPPKSMKYEGLNRAFVYY